MLKRKKYYVVCPVCGRILFRSSGSDAEIQCCKCRSELAVEVSGGKVVVSETLEEAKQPIE